jgi:hypothetical protein
MLMSHWIFYLCSSVKQLTSSANMHEQQKHDRHAADGGLIAVAVAAQAPKP